MSKRLCAIAVIFMGSGFELVPAEQLSDPNPAMNNPDKVAWDLFVELNRPALKGKRGVPDPNKKHGALGPRVWETWKQTSTPGNEVFLENGADPGKWDTPQKTSQGELKKVFSLPKSEVIRLLDAPAMNSAETGSAETGLDKRLSEALVLNDNAQESKINQPGFDFIVREHLYSLDGQERFRATGCKVEFPVGTINVKASWRRFTPEEIEAGKDARYYTYTEPDGKKKWGLTGFHMTSKDIPNWLWATFEHVDNPPPEIPDLDRYTEFLNPRQSPSPPPTEYSVEQRLRKVPEPLRNTYWQNYVLRGTQVDFVDSMGNSTLLGNTQLENGMQVTASCIGCHGRSTIGDRFDNFTINGRRLYPDGTYFFPGGHLIKVGDPSPGEITSSANRLTVNPAKVFWQLDPQHPDNNTAAQYVMGAIGAPKPEWFLDSAGNSRYTQLDFIWGFIHAQREPWGFIHAQRESP
jgi:hypothetical protein